MKNERFDKDESKIPSAIEDIMAMRPVKIAIYVGGALAVIYFLGLAFKVVAGTVRDYKGLTGAIKL